MSVFGDLTQEEIDRMWAEDEAEALELHREVFGACWASMLLLALEENKDNEELNAEPPEETPVR